MEIMSSIFDFFADTLKSVLPLSPFQQFISEIGSFEYLGWLNWFFPVGDCLKVLSAWLAAIGAFYLYSIILRWIKAIH